MQAMREQLDAIEHGEADLAAQEAAAAGLETTRGVGTHEPLGLADLLHHRVASVDAVGAADALHLQAVADVDSGRADLDAAEAVDAVAAIGDALGARLAAPHGRGAPG